MFLLFLAARVMIVFFLDSAYFISAKLPPMNVYIVNDPISNAWLQWILEHITTVENDTTESRPASICTARYN